MKNFSRKDLEALDRDDPLAFLRDKFFLPDGMIYLDGNSLGALPKATRHRLQHVVDVEWGQWLIQSWNKADWINAPARVGAKISRLIGAKKSEVICADSTSVNLFKLVTSALRLQKGRTRVITEPGNFPTDLYVLRGIEDLLPEMCKVAVVDPERILSEIDDTTALVVLTHVHYKTGLIHDMAEITKKAHEHGALVLWDLSHSAGAISVDLTEIGADFAVGCGYKYLNGGPGAPAYLFVAERHQNALSPPLSGWLGHAAPFDFDDAYRPAEGIARNLCGTPYILGLAALEEGVDVLNEVDIDVIRSKSKMLGDIFISLIDEYCSCQEIALVSPRDSGRRGSQVSVSHPNGYRFMRKLIAHGIVGDFRAPDIMRFGLSPLYLRYVDMWDAVQGIAEVMSSMAAEPEEPCDRCVLRSVVITPPQCP